MPRPETEVGAPGRPGPQLRLPGHDLTAFDKTGLPAKTKFNSFRVALLYPPHPPSFSQPTTIGPPVGSPRPGLLHSTILVATEPRKAERLIFKRSTPKLPLEFLQYDTVKLSRESPTPPALWFLDTAARKPLPVSPFPGLCHSASLDVKPFQVWCAILAWTRAAPVSKRESNRAAFTISRQISSKTQLR